MFHPIEYLSIGRSNFVFLSIKVVHFTFVLTIGQGYHNEKVSSCMVRWFFVSNPMRELFITDQPLIELSPIEGERRWNTEEEFFLLVSHFET